MRNLLIRVIKFSTKRAQFIHGISSRFFFPGLIKYLSCSVVLICLSYVIFIVDPLESLITDVNIPIIISSFSQWQFLFLCSKPRCGKAALSTIYGRNPHYLWSCKFLFSTLQTLKDFSAALTRNWKLRKLDLTFISKFHRRLALK